MLNQVVSKSLTRPERRTAYRHAATLDREAGAHVWSCCDVACLLDSQRLQALETPHDWAIATAAGRPRGATRVIVAQGCEGWFGPFACVALPRQRGARVGV